MKKGLERAQTTFDVAFNKWWDDSWKKVCYSCCAVKVQDNAEKHLIIKGKKLLYNLS